MPLLTRGMVFGSGPGVGGKGYVRINGAVVSRIFDVPPVAHRQAAQDAATACARAIGGRGTGKLARSVRQPKSLGPLRSAVGSSLVYARIQNTGGVIHGRPVMAIHAGVGDGGPGEGPVVGRARSVRIRGKHYLNHAAPVYLLSMFDHLRDDYAAVGLGV